MKHNTLLHVANGGLGVPTPGCMMCGLCMLCEKEATGLASITVPGLGEIRLCHGDDDEEPTHYQLGQWALSGTDHSTVLDL